MRNLAVILFILLFVRQAAIAQQALPPAEVKVIQQFKAPAPVFFEHITQQQGLPAGRSTPLLRDHLGFLWVQNYTQGLLRYDGIGFQEIRDTSDPVADGRIIACSMAEDGEGNLWIGSTAGLKRFDPATGVFTKFPNTTGNTNLVNYVLMDRRQRLWVSIETEGFFQVDRSTGIFKAYRPDQVYDGFSGRVSAWEPPLTGNFMQEDGDGILWMTAGNADHPQGLFSFDPANVKWSFFPFYWKTPEGKKKSAIGIYCLYVGAENRYIWLGTYSGVGLLRLDKKQKRWKQYLFETPAGVSLPENYINTIAPGQNGGLWLGMDEKSMLFDIAQETGSFYAHRPDDLTSLPKIAGNIHLRDQEGISWFGVPESGNSLTKIVPGHQFFKNAEFLVGLKSVSGIWKSPLTGDLFYAINKHEVCTIPLLVKINGKNGKTSVRSCPEIPELSCGNNAIHAIKGDPSGTFLWVLTANGLFRLDIISQKLTAVGAPIFERPNSTTDSFNYSSISIGPEGRVWLGANDGSLLWSDTGSGKFHISAPEKGSPGGLQYTFIKTIFCDRKGRVWVGYRFNNGIARFDPETGAVTHFKASPGDSTALQDGVVFGFAETDDGRIWVSYRNGFCFITPDDKVHPMPVVARLDPRNLVKDQQDHLWLTTHANTLLHFIPKTGSVQVFDYQNGFVERDFTDCLYAAADGKVFFSDQYRWRPETLRCDSTPFHIVFSRFRIFEKDTFFTRDLNYLDQVTLRHDQNFFSISFAALALANPAKNTYSYRLEGLEKNWTPAGNRHEASYTNLQPGNYTFWVKAANEDGIWSAAPISLNIRILPAWWQTSWFRFLIVLSASILIAVFYRQHLARVHAKAEAKQKTAELQQLQAEFRQRLAETEMATLRAQMNPHFLFNVMNSIHRFLLENDAEAASVYLTKFSRLIRLVLENSASEKVTLENELEALRLYIEMETLRFKQKVRYQMDIEPDIDLKFTRIPPLLLQPYVENAIWHGLLHKEAGGIVTISILQPEENVLHVEITDDGIGRQAATALKSKSAQRHKSFGMQVTQKRIEIINELFNTETQIEIFDLVTPDGNAAGTRVTLYIPV